MMKLAALIMKRPSDSQIRYWKLAVGLVIVIAGLLAFYVQNLELESSIFGIQLGLLGKELMKHSMIMLGLLPMLFGGLDVNFLSKGRTRILQIVFAFVLFTMSGMFQETASLGANILYFILGLIVLFAGITGKAITKKGLRTGQKLTKIRV